jgi:hypothetical protein
MEINPYAPSTTAPVQPDSMERSDAELIRRKYLSHEASIKSVGSLYLLGAIPSMLLGVLSFLSGIGELFGFGLIVENQSTAGGNGLESVVLGLVLVGIGFLQGYAGWSLRKLNRGGKIYAIVVSCIGLIGFPIGTLISAYILYLLVSAKGAFVFSDEYKSVVESTPHIRYKTSIVVWILLFLLIIVVLAAFVGIFLSATPRPRRYSSETLQSSDRFSG